MKNSITQPEIKPATIRLAQCIDPNLPDNNDDNHKKRKVACLLAENNIRIRSTAFHFTKPFDRIFIRETAGFLWILFFHTCLTVSSSVCKLACNNTSENKRNSVFKLLFQTPSIVSCWSITNTKIFLTSLHLQGTFTFKQHQTTFDLYSRAPSLQIMPSNETPSNIWLKRTNMKTNYLIKEKIKLKWSAI